MWCVCLMRLLCSGRSEHGAHERRVGQHHRRRERVLIEQFGPAVAAAVLDLDVKQIKHACYSRGVRMVRHDSSRMSAADKAIRVQQAKGLACSRVRCCRCPAASDRAQGHRQVQPDS